MRPFMFSGPIALAAAVWLLAACAGYGPQSLAVGTPRGQVEQAMGPPTGVHPPLPGGDGSVSTRLEYARGPFGKHTFMLDFDAQGRLMSWTQVLTEPQFNAIVKNMSQTEVLQRLGQPSNVRTVGMQKQTVWSYRYESAFCQWFEIGIEQGLVVDSLYTPDPQCEDRGDRPSLL